MKGSIGSSMRGFDKPRTAKQKKDERLRKLDNKKTYKREYYTALWCENCLRSYENSKICVTCNNMDLKPVKKYRVNYNPPSKKNFGPRKPASQKNDFPPSP